MLCGVDQKYLKKCFNAFLNHALWNLFCEFFKFKSCKLLKHKSSENSYLLVYNTPRIPHEECKWKDSKMSFEFHSEILGKRLVFTTLDYLCIFPFWNSAFCLVFLFSKYFICSVSKKCLDSFFFVEIIHHLNVHIFLNVCQT